MKNSFVLSMIASSCIFSIAAEAVEISDIENITMQIVKNRDSLPEKATRELVLPLHAADKARELSTREGKGLSNANTVRAKRDDDEQNDNVNENDQSASHEHPIKTTLTLPAQASDHAQEMQERENLGLNRANDVRLEKDALANEQKDTISGQREAREEHQSVLTDQAESARQNSGSAAQDAKNALSDVAQQHRNEQADLAQDSIAKVRDQNANLASEAADKANEAKKDQAVELPDAAQAAGDQAKNNGNSAAHNPNNN